MTELHVRALTSDLQVRDGGDGRTLVGPLIPWGVEARVLDRGRLVVETFERGALAGNDPTRIQLTALHPRDNQQLPIGVTVELEERDDAAWGAWRVSKTAAGDEVLELARDRVPLGLSIGFREVDGVAAGPPTANGSSGPGPTSTTSPWSGHRPTKGPGWWASVGTYTAAPPRPCSPWPGSGMGKRHINVGVGSKQGWCRGCRRQFIGPGERCQDCQRKLRERQRRKPR